MALRGRQIVALVQVGNNYTIRFDAELYQIDRAAIVSGLRRANVRVEPRGQVAVPRVHYEALSPTPFICRAVQKCEDHSHLKGRRSGP